MFFDLLQKLACFDNELFFKVFTIESRVILSFTVVLVVPLYLTNLDLLLLFKYL